MAKTKSGNAFFRLKSLKISVIGVALNVNHNLKGVLPTRGNIARTAQINHTTAIIM